ncbi:MAG: glycerophosphodiester phosphodiesterase family protein, partial [Candidatus Neomarinimicrobiota bacterium]
GKALQAGLRGTELDVIETKDGHLVCSHNFDLERVTDGEGYLFERELPYLTRINAAHHFKGYPFENIPLLEDVLSFFPTDFRINIEVKPRSLGDLFTTIKVARIVSQRNLQNRVIISSFNPLALLGVKLVDASILTGFLIEPDTWPLFRLINVGHPDCLHLDAGLVSNDLLRYARQRGMVVNVWTVNNKPAIDWLVNKGVDGIITDRPEYCELR